MSNSFEIPDPDRILGLQERIQYPFKHLGLLTEALTHSSYRYEHEHCKEDNERLEFLGDALLSVVTAEHLFLDAMHYDEGKMTRFRAASVCEESLAMAARDIGLGDCLYLGKGEAQSGGREKDSNLSNALEALFAAVYLDSDFEHCRQLIHLCMGRYFVAAQSGRLSHDYKTALLEWAQSLKGNHPVSFHLIREEGPVHERSFTTEVVFDREHRATGTGRSKKISEQNASRILLARMQNKGDKKD